MNRVKSNLWKFSITLLGVECGLNSPMAANRKLQQQVDSTLKKIDEGIVEFGEQWGRVEENNNPNLRVCLVVQAPCDLFH
jgi:hypothetical protein